MPQGIATFAGGCFWCLEAAFELLRGVEVVESGYMGGTTPDPGYEQVCSGRTGHAEVVQVTFDPGEIPYRDLLSVFFTMHDPTTVDRQGPDVGTQYRSAIFHHSPEQESQARQAIARLERDAIFGAPIVTQVTAATRFWRAEEPHQGYFRRVGGRNPYCTQVIAPKVAKLRRLFVERLKR